MGWSDYALPNKIEYVDYGPKHEKLKYYQKHCIIFSGGDRYEHLNRKTKKYYSNVDESTAIDLMDSPIAMNPSLNSVLFILEQLKFYVANAGPHGAAYSNTF